jgi:hypothetical protein
MQMKVWKQFDLARLEREVNAWLKEHQHCSMTAPTYAITQRVTRHPHLGTVSVTEYSAAVFYTEPIMLGKEEDWYV